MRNRYLFMTTMLLLFAGAAYVGTRGVGARPVAGNTGGHAHTPEGMQRWVNEWYAHHPRVGEHSLAAAADTFRVADFYFDSDGNPDTQPDTAYIGLGGTILWQWVDGSHTTTNGLASFDPTAGQLWDQPITAANPEYARVFDQLGVFPFFCRVHESQMRGYVAVLDATPTEPTTWGDLKHRYR